MPFNVKNDGKTPQYDTLADFINRMSSFDPSLFERLVETVVSKLRPVNSHEVQVFETYSDMLRETEQLIRSKQIRKDSIDSSDGTTDPVQA